MKLLFDRKTTKPTTALVRSRIGAKVRWHKADYTYRGFIYEGRTGVGFLEEISGRNVRIGGDYLWLPDIERMWVLDQDEDKVL